MHYLAECLAVTERVTSCISVAFNRWSFLCNVWNCLSVLCAIVLSFTVHQYSLFCRVRTRYSKSVCIVQGPIIFSGRGPSDSKLKVFLQVYFHPLVLVVVRLPLLHTEGTPSLVFWKSLKLAIAMILCHCRENQRTIFQHLSGGWWIQGSRAVTEKMHDVVVNFSYTLKFTAASHGSPCNSTALVCITLTLTW